MLAVAVQPAAGAGAAFQKTAQQLPIVALHLLVGMNLSRRYLQGLPRKLGLLLPLKQGHWQQVQRLRPKHQHRPLCLTQRLLRMGRARRGAEAAVPARAHRNKPRAAQAGYHNG